MQKVEKIQMEQIKLMLPFLKKYENMLEHIQLAFICDKVDKYSYFIVNGENLYVTPSFARDYVDNELLVTRQKINTIELYLKTQI